MTRRPKLEYAQCQKVPAKVRGDNFENLGIHLAGNDDTIGMGKDVHTLTASEVSTTCNRPEYQRCLGDEDALQSRAIPGRRDARGCNRTHIR